MRIFEPDKILILTGDLGSIGVNQIIAIIFPLVVYKEGVGTKEKIYAI